MADNVIKRKFVQALPSDNPYLRPEYIDVLKDTFAHRPELLKAYLYGSWEALEGADQIIKRIWLEQAQSRVIYSMPKRPRLCIDSARFGDDETVLYYSEVTDIDDQVIMPHTRTTDISTKAAAMSYEHDNCPIVVETTGGDLGAGVIDELVAQGKVVITYTPQGASNEPDKYGNLRAEAWSTAATMLCQGNVMLWHGKEKKKDPTLITQLCTPTYKFRAGKTLVEEKDQIKARLGRSPDRADCYIILLWSYGKVPLVDKEEAWPESTEMAESYTVKSAF